MTARMIMAGAVIALAGCTGGGVLPPLANATGVKSIALLGGDFIATGPDGYCVDLNASNRRSGFALMAPCGVLGVKNASLQVQAVTTVQVGAAGSAIVGQNPAAFAAYLAGPAGPKLLSRIGDPDTVTVTDVAQTGVYVTVHLIDAAPAALDGVQEAEWRAFVDIAGRLVTIAVRGLDAAPLSTAAGDALLLNSVTAVMQANAASNN